MAKRQRTAMLRQDMEITVNGKQYKLNPGSLLNYVNTHIDAPVVSDILQYIKNSPWILAVVKKIANEMIQVNFEFEGDIKKGKKYIELMKNPNPWNTYPQFMKILVSWYETVGEAPIIKERNLKGDVVGLYPLNPMDIIHYPDGTQDYYTISMPGTQKGSMDIAKEDIIFWYDPDPKNPYRGWGLAQALIDELQTDEYAAKHTKSWFYNRATPELIVSIPGVRQEQLEQAKNHWLQNNLGFMKAFKPHFVNYQVQVHPITQNFSDMQLVELRKFERNIILNVYGVPPEIFGIIENSNRSTIAAATAILTRGVIAPRILDFEAVMNKYFFSEVGLQIKYQKVAKESIEMLIEIMKSMPWAFTVDEIRTIAGLQKLGDERGDYIAVPVNMQMTKDFKDLSGFDKEV